MTGQCSAAGLLLTWASHPPASAESDQSNDESYCPELWEVQLEYNSEGLAFLALKPKVKLNVSLFWTKKKSQLSWTWVWGMIWFISSVGLYTGFLGGLVVKNSPASVGDVNSTPKLGRSPGVGNGNLLQYSCLGNPTDRDWWAAVHGIAKSQIWLSTHACIHAHMGIYEEDCIQKWSRSGDIASKKHVTYHASGTSLVVQWLRLCAAKAGGLGSIPAQGTRSHMPQLRSKMSQLKFWRLQLKTQGRQINTQIFFKTLCKQDTYLLITFI